MQQQPQNLDFLIPEDTNNLHEELYSVEQDKLLPITSPFLMPGIYKKIGVDCCNGSNFNNLSSNITGSNNVFISAQEPCGRIVSLGEFQNLYSAAKQEQHQYSDSRPRDGQKSEHFTSLKKQSGGSNEDPLSKFASDIISVANRDCVLVDRKHKAIVRTPFGSNQKTVYRFFTPEKLGLKTPKDSSGLNLANGTISANQFDNFKERPRKRTAVNRIKQNQIKKHAPNTESNNNRDKEETKEGDQKILASASLSQQSSVRTRSGRLVKLIKPDLIASATEQTPITDISQKPPTPAAIMDLLADLKDRDYTCKNMNADRTLTKPQLETTGSHFESIEHQSTSALTNNPPTKRRVPPEAICPTCNKIFLGRRLQRHFAQHPDHMVATSVINSTQFPPPPPPPSMNNTNSWHETALAADEITLFRFLTSKLQKSNLNEDQRAELFLNEINDLVEQLQLRSSRLIRSTSGLHMVTAPTARVLGIPEGQYALDMSAIEAPPPEPETSTSLINFTNTLPAPNVNTRSLDYTSVSIDDTLTDEAVQKLNLSAGGKLLPPSEESLLRAVDDFVVRDGMEKLSETNLLHPPVVNVTQTKAVVVPHIDHASDNAVEAVTMKETPTAQQQSPMLDLAVDFFQFNNNKN